jgi:hypothetical protein
MTVGRNRKLKKNYGLVICSWCGLPCCKHGFCINLDCTQYQVCQCEIEYAICRLPHPQEKTQAVDLSHASQN